MVRLTREVAESIRCLGDDELLSDSCCVRGVGCHGVSRCVSCGLEVTPVGWVTWRCRTANRERGAIIGDSPGGEAGQVRGVGAYLRWQQSSRVWRCGSMLLSSCQESDSVEVCKTDVHRSVFGTGELVPSIFTTILLCVLPTTVLLPARLMWLYYYFYYYY